MRLRMQVPEPDDAHLNQAVNVCDAEGRTVSESECGKASNLDHLLKAITPENPHEAVDFGPPKGNEVW